MGDFSFLRTGFNLVGDANGGDPEFERNMGALLLLFAEDALRIGGSCAIAAGRRTVLEEDVRAAMKYVARSFLGSVDLEARFPQACADLDAMTDEEEDGEEGGEDEEEECVGLEDEATQVDEGDRATAIELKARVDACVASWHEWEPTDPAEIFLKRHIDAADQKVGYA